MVCSDLHMPRSFGQFRWRPCRKNADSSGVNDGSVPLINVVKGLGEYLTSTEDDTRLKGKFRRGSKIDGAGLSFLTNLIKAIQPSKINRQTSKRPQLRTVLSTDYISSDVDTFLPVQTGRF